MSLKVIDTGIASPEKNMQIDLALLEALEMKPEGILHLYDWDGPSATYGYFANPNRLLKNEGIVQHSLKLAKRPTGGGIIFHQYDLAFSFLLSAAHPKFSMNTLDNYQFVNSAIAEAIFEALSLDCLPQLQSQNNCNCKSIPQGQFCMALPTIYDLILEGRKVAGAAQRRSKLGYLHQGSISLLLPSDQFLEDLLLPESGIAESMKRSTFPLLGHSQKDLKESRQELNLALIKCLGKALSD